MTNWSWEEIDKQLRRRLRDRYPNEPDVVQETMFRLFLKLRSGIEIRASPEAYAMGIADNVQKEIWEQERRSVQIVTEFAAVQPPPSHSEPSEEDLEALKKYVFSATERKLFEEYFRHNRNIQKRREQLASKLGISMNTLYQRMHRLKERLILEHRRRQQEEQA